MCTVLVTVTWRILAASAQGARATPAKAANRSIIRQTARGFTCMLIQDSVLIGSVLDQPIRILTQSALREFKSRCLLGRLGLLSPAVRAVLVQLDGVIHGDGVSSFGYKSPIQQGQIHFF